MIMVEFLVKIFSISQGSKMDAEYIDPYEINRPINIPEVLRPYMGGKALIK